MLDPYMPKPTSIQDSWLGNVTTDKGVEVRWMTFHVKKLIIDKITYRHRMMYFHPKSSKRRSTVCRISQEKSSFTVPTIPGTSYTYGAVLFHNYHFQGILYTLHPAEQFWLYQKRKESSAGLEKDQPRQLPQVQSSS